MLIGPTVAQGNVVLDGFQSHDEPQKKIMQVVHHTTAGELDSLITPRLEHAAGPKQVLRIDVEPAKFKHIRFRGHGDAEWYAYCRRGSENQIMTPEQISEFNDRSKAPIRIGSVAEHVSMPTFHAPRSSPRKNHGSNRFYTSTSEHLVPLFGFSPSLDGFDTSAFVHVRDHCNLGPKETWPVFLAAAKELAGEYALKWLTFSIKQGRRIRTGIGAKALLHDVENIDCIGESLAATDLHGPQGHLRPVVTGQMTIPNGFLWFQTEAIGENNWFYGECGVVLEHLPFNGSPFQEFFATVRAEPPEWQSIAGPQMLTMHGNITASGATVVKASDDDRQHLFVEIDNPLLARPGQIQAVCGEVYGKRLIEKMLEVPRLMVQMRGGALPGDGELVLGPIYLFSLQSREEILFVHALASAI